MKSITKAEMDALIKAKIMRNTDRGLVSNRHNFTKTDKTENPVGFYRTQNKRYIEDYFADVAKSLVESGGLIVQEEN